MIATVFGGCLNDLSPTTGNERTYRKPQVAHSAVRPGQEVSSTKKATARMNESTLLNFPWCKNRLGRIRFLFSLMPVEANCEGNWMMAALITIVKNGIGEDFPLL